MRTKRVRETGGMGGGTGLDGALAQFQALSNTLAAAEALVSMRRRIDLGGLDEQVRQLCATTLRLRPEGSAALRRQVLRLLSRTDSLHAAMIAGAEQ